MSTDFNKYERKIAGWLSKMPMVKKYAKIGYSHINYLFFGKKKKIDTQFNIISVSDDYPETFFGYYDKSPLNYDGNYLVFHASTYPTNSVPHSNHQIQVLLKDLTNDTIAAEFNSSAYNWQQGAKLQWLDNNHFIFNDYDTKHRRYVSNIVSTSDNGIERKIDYPVYDTHKNIAVSLNFDRLALLRPDYGYRNRKHEKDIDLFDLKNDGIYFVDLKSNSQRLLISLADLVSIDYTKQNNNILHKVNHIMISPLGDRFVFLHRYFINGVKFDRLVLSNIEGTQIKILSDHEMVSHYFWKDNHKIISFMRRFGEGDKYYEIDIDTGNILPIGRGIIDKYGDGHTSIWKDLLLFDTYPNKTRMKKLFVYNLVSGELLKIGEFFEPFRYNGETRCDLHPRWAPDGKSIFIDSVHSGKRKLYQINISPIIHE